MAELWPQIVLVWSLLMLLGITGYAIWRGIFSLLHRSLHGDHADFPCPSCGYDIRHTPHRCPECGAILRWGETARWKDI